MIKVLNQYFPGRLFVLLATENALILLGIWLALSWHLGSMESLLQYPGLFGKALLITMICQLCLYYADIYDLRILNSKLDVLIRLLQALGAAALLLAGLFYFFPDLRMGTGVVETTIVAVVVVILGWRVLVEWLNRAYGSGERVLLVGSGSTVRALAEEVRQRQDLPLKLVGAVVESAAHENDMPGVKTLGHIDDLKQVVEESKPTRLVIALAERRNKLPLDLLLDLRLKGMLVEEGSTLYEKVSGRLLVDGIRPSSLIYSDGFRQSTWIKIYGRLAGFVAAVFALIFLGPVLLLLAAIIKLDSKGPVFYKQERVGLNGKSFFILKFRSMRSDAEKLSGPVWAEEDDPRITRVGRYLRKLRLDELPQFINVLRGEMSFVGPRPERPFFVDLLKQQIPFYDLRHYVRPGITGWAQVSHHYGASVDEAKQKLEYDLFYIKNVSLSLDLLILFQTVKIVMFGRGAR